MTGCSSLSLLMVRPHNAQTILPSPLFGPASFSRRRLVFRARGIPKRDRT
jgi:hypothetical protein